MKNNKNGQGVTLSRRTLIILSVIIILLVAGGVTVGMNWNRWFGPDDPTPAGQFTPELDSDAQSWSGDQLPDKTAEDKEASVGIKIPGYPSIGLPADTKDVQVALLNPEGNSCYFTFTLVLSDSDEVLYTSKMVPPGQMISDITLSRALPRENITQRYRLRRPLWRTAPL